MTRGLLPSHLRSNRCGCTSVRALNLYCFWGRARARMQHLSTLSQSGPANDYLAHRPIGSAGALSCASQHCTVARFTETVDTQEVVSPRLNPFHHPAPGWMTFLGGSSWTRSLVRFDINLITTGVNSLPDVDQCGQVSRLRPGEKGDIIGNARKRSSLTCEYEVYAHGRFVTLVSDGEIVGGRHICSKPREAYLLSLFWIARYEDRYRAPLTVNRSGLALTAPKGPVHMPHRENEKTDASQVTEVQFIADVHLIQVLGEQLIGSEKVGILELIKNAYDAGATRCDVWIEKVPGLPDVEVSDPQLVDLPGPVITIADNGSGMNSATIRNGWLRPASRLKTSVKERLKRERHEADQRGTRDKYELLVSTLKKEHAGRLPLGEKGVGRFATHRLGRYLILQTKVKDEPHEWLLEIDWNMFNAPDDEPHDLDKVKLELIERVPQRNYGPTNSGTLLRMYGGRTGFEWTEETLKEIGQAIALLHSPVEKRRPSRFEVYFHCPQLSDQDFRPLTDTVLPPFVCTAIVDEKGRADIEIRFEPPPTLRKPFSAQSWMESAIDLRKPPENQPRYWSSQNGNSHLRRPQCGPFTVDIKLWLRAKEWIEAPDWKEFTEFLDEFGGLGIYRDGLSILPAQIASKDDWLRLSTRHIKKGTHISYYQMAGSVNLLQEKTLDLVDRTSREGMIETTAYSDLRQLVRQIVLALEFRVEETRTRYNHLLQGEGLSQAALNQQMDAAKKILTKLASNYQFETDPWGLREIMRDKTEVQTTVSEIGVALDQARREIREQKAQTNSLLEAAGYGIAIAVAVHEIEKITSNLYFGLQRLTKRALDLDQESYEKSRQLSQTAQSLLNELKRIAPLRVTQLERSRKFPVRDTILAAMGAFRLSWEELNIAFSAPTKSNDFEVEGSFGACSQVFANLFDNSTYWLRSSNPNERRIRVEVDPSDRKIVVADSGPGIDEKMRSHLFELFYSLKNPPSGLGLYICSYYMRQMRGTIREAFDRERIPGFPGAQFVLQFPKER